MSIINDALKKTQDKLSERKENKAAAKSGGPDKNSGDGKNMFMLLLIIIITLGAVYWITLELKPHILGLIEHYKQVPPPSAPQQTEPPEEIKKTAAPVSALTVEELKDLKLSGLVYSEDGNAALLNNNIYEEGDVIEGYSITEIRAKSVIFEKDGTLYEIETRN